MSASGPQGALLESCLCTQTQLESEPFVRWARAMQAAWTPDGSGRPVNLHRKLWEWIFIARVLEQRDMLRPGRTGLGFGVGNEPQAALFASRGCRILATDLSPADHRAAHWSGAGQHASALDTLNRDGLCPQGAFAASVSFRHVDMTRIPHDLSGFDFTWSSCAFEHLGNIVKGQEFVLAQMDCLRPGGVAVHTTEFNLSSNWRTLDWAQTVLFREKDIQELAAALRADGHGITLRLDPGHLPADEYCDVPPYSSGAAHLKLRIGRYRVTSLGLVITKGDRASRSRGRRVGSPLKTALSQSRRLDSALGSANRAARQVAKRLLRRAFKA
jgi:SAM-dependent methyltransferase